MIGHKDLMRQFKVNIEKGRVPHAQIFEGKSGYGTLPFSISYAKSIIESSSIDKKTVDPLNHPDIHYFFPVINRASSSSPSTSKDYLSEWKNFLKKSYYSYIEEWYNFIEAGNKQGVITADEAQNIIKTLSLKSYSGGYKVLIIWHAEKMNIACSNKLLKWIEEPNPNTCILLITEKSDDLIKTIRSRCQITKIGKINPEDMAQELIKRGFNEVSTKLAANKSTGNFNKAIQILDEREHNEDFEKLFIEWVRASFSAKTNKKSINKLIEWSEKMSKLGREIEKQFLEYSLEFFRQAMILNYNGGDLVTLKIKDNSFSLKKFSLFIGGKNIEGIFHEIEKAIFHIERNGNPKIIFTDLSIKLTRLLHKNS